MLLLSLIVFILEFLELTLFLVQGSQSQNGVLAVKVREYGLRDYLAKLHKLAAALSELADTANAEVLTLTTHTLQESCEVLWDLLRTD